MISSLIFALSSFLALLPTTPAKDTHALTPNPPRSITVSESAAPPVIHAGLLQSTLILLPAEEKVATVFGGDTVDWVFDAGHIASRFLSIKPKLANVTTDLHIISDHGNEYTLQIDEVSGQTNAHFDSKVFLLPAEAAAASRLASPPVFVPASELDKAKQAAAAAEAAAAAVRKAEDAKAEQFRSQYPASLHFDYVWDVAKGHELGLQAIWRDNHFTYLRGVFQETPALYELKDGKGSLINFDFNAGLYTIPKELEAGYLTIGKKKVLFHRIAEGN